MKIFKRVEEIDVEKYIVATYFLESKTGKVRDVAEALAIGQSIGNPYIRSVWETDEMINTHICWVEESEELENKTAVVKIFFPIANIDLYNDGISQLLVQLMGGQLDIDIVQTCHLIDIDLPASVLQCFNGPYFGIKGIRKFTEVEGKPLLGAIVKPKVGMKPDHLLDMVKQLVDGGVNFIKEDEIMSNPACCPIEERVPLIANFLDGKKIIYAVCITSDPTEVLTRVSDVYEMGANAIHVNFWSGLGIYNSIRKLSLPLFLFFQKSGDKILTNKHHAFHIDWQVVCKLAGLMGVDFIHAGMWGGYSNDEEADLFNVVKILHQHDVMPSLSCGMHPGLVEAIVNRIGVDFMANVGGAIHGHPWGTTAGAIAMRQAIDKTYGQEYEKAIAQWGKVK